MTTITKSKLSEKIGYGFGDFASSMFWKIFTYYLPFFYSNVYGLRLEDTAVLLLITKLWDGVSDPMMGVIADRTSTRWGRYRPYLLWIALPFAIAGVLTFTTPDFAYAGKLVWAYSTYILMMTVYTAINVPYGAMLGVVSADGRQRTIFSAFRMFFAYGGSFVALAIFEPVRDMFGEMSGVANPATDPASWSWAMIVVAALCFIFFILTFLLTKERVHTKVEKSGRNIGKDLKALGKNRPWWILLGASISILIFNSIRGGTAAYFFADYIGSDGGVMGALFGYSLVLSTALFLAVGEIANMLGVVLAVPLARVLGKKGAFIVAILFAGVLSALFGAFGEPSLFNLWAMLILQVLISIGAGVLLPLVWSMFADVADYSELKNGRGSIGLIFSSSSMAQKFGGALGSYLVLWLLSVYGYQTPEGGGVSVEQSQGTLDGLMALMSWIPALACALAAIIMIRYPLGSARMEQIDAELKVRRSSESVE